MISGILANGLPKLQRQRYMIARTMHDIRDISQWATDTAKAEIYDSGDYA